MEQKDKTRLKQKMWLDCILIINWQEEIAKMGCCDTKMPRNQVSMNKIYSNSTHQSGSDAPNMYIERKSEKSRKSSRTSEFLKPSIQIYSEPKDFKSSVDQIPRKGYDKNYNSKYRLAEPQTLNKQILRLDDIEFVNNSDIHIEIEEEPDTKTKASQLFNIRLKIEKQNDSFETKTSSTEKRQQHKRISYNQGVDSNLRGVHFEKAPQKLQQFGNNDLNLRQTFMPVKCYSNDIGFKPKRYEGGLSVISEVLSGVDTDNNNKRSSIIVSDDNEKDRKYPSSTILSNQPGKTRTRATFGPRPKKYQNIAPIRAGQSEVSP